MAGNKHWTKREENKIIKEISKNSENLSYCFARLATEMHRSEGAISKHWYYKLRPKMKDNPKRAAFALADKSKINPAVKNVKRGKEVGGITINADKLKRVLESIFSILAE